VKVWKSVIYPNAPLAMHRHEHLRVIVVVSGALAGGALAGGKLNIVEQSGPSEMHDWQTGNAYWLPASPPGDDAFRRERRRQTHRSGGSGTGKGKVARWLSPIEALARRPAQHNHIWRVRQ
jgi:hypothetical protein